MTIGPDPTELIGLGLIAEKKSFLIIKDHSLPIYKLSCKDFGLEVRTAMLHLIHDNKRLVLRNPGGTSTKQRKKPPLSWETGQQLLQKFRINERGQQWTHISPWSKNKSQKSKEADRSRFSLLKQCAHEHGERWWSYAWHPAFCEPIDEKESSIKNLCVYICPYFSCSIYYLLCPNFVQYIRLYTNVFISLHPLWDVFMNKLHPFLPFFTYRKLAK